MARVDRYSENRPDAFIPWLARAAAETLQENTLRPIQTGKGGRP